MRGQLKTAEAEGEELKAVKEREEVLSRQIKQLSKQLVEARRHHTPVHTHTPSHPHPRFHAHSPTHSHPPTHTHTHTLMVSCVHDSCVILFQEMHHFSTLLAKITTLETRSVVLMHNTCSSPSLPLLSLSLPSLPPSLSLTGCQSLSVSLDREWRDFVSQSLTRSNKSRYNIKITHK